MKPYCFENMLLREESASVEYLVKVTYHKPLTENYNYVHKSCLFGNKWNGGNRSVYGLEDRYA